MTSREIPTGPSIRSKFKDAVYVLHAFQKKSKKGIGTDKSDLELVEGRLKSAEADDAKRTK